jgi:hypothetical protein
MNKEKVLKEFQLIPGIGKACSIDLWNIGLRSIDDIRGQDPSLLYQKLNILSGVQHDICMLYTLRLVVYYATEKTHDKIKLKWWYWKDKTYNEHPRKQNT